MILSGGQLEAIAALSLDPTPSTDMSSVDVHVAKAVTVPPHGFKVVDALEEVHMPSDVAAFITGRSSHMRAGVTMPGGVVDPSFNDRLALEFFNHSDEEFVIEAGTAAGRLTYFKIKESVGIEARFWSKVDVATPKSCWEWQGARNKEGGYGAFAPPDGWSVLAHRIAWRLERGEIGDHCVLHECDNKLCVNPSHLYLGDDSDNQRDAVKRGQHGGAKLTPDQVETIRSKYDEGGITQQELANEYGVAQSNISKIVNHERYQL